jgi:hypothetical protein
MVERLSFNWEGRSIRKGYREELRRQFRPGLDSWLPTNKLPREQVPETLILLETSTDGLYKHPPIVRSPLNVIHTSLVGDAIKFCPVQEVSVVHVDDRSKYKDILSASENFAFIPWPSLLYALSTRVIMLRMPMGAAPLPCPRPMSLALMEPQNEGSFAMPKPDLIKYSIICIVDSMR